MQLHSICRHVRVQFAPTSLQGLQKQSATNNASLKSRPRCYVKSPLHDSLQPYGLNDSAKGD